MKESMDRLDADSSAHVLRMKHDTEQAQQALTAEFESRLQEAKDELTAFQRASKHKEEQAADDAQAIQENHEREMAGMRKSIADVKASFSKACCIIAALLSLPFYTTHFDPISA